MSQEADLHKTPILDVQASKLRNKFMLFVSRLVYGIVLEHPKWANDNF